MVFYNEYAHAESDFNMTCLLALCSTEENRTFHCGLCKMSFANVRFLEEDKIGTKNINYTVTQTFQTMCNCCCSKIDVIFSEVTGSSSPSSLLVGAPLAFGSELVSRLRVAQPPLMDATRYF